ncbi:MAG: helix-turn-helix domain-containing protein [Bacteroidetes bacterium]|nr:helix-turn-helix domain-containing protein [Bacteroidota bacterium]
MPAEKRIPFLEITIRKWQQQLMENRRKFRTLLKDGELDADPENMQNDLDEDELAISRLQLWLDIDQSGIENSDMSSVSDTDSESNSESVSEPQERDRDYMNVDQLSDYLGISASAIYTMSSKGTIPRTKLGNRVIFNKDEIDKWLRERNE